MEIIATFLLPVALDGLGNLGVSAYNADVTSIEVPAAPLGIFDPQIEIVRDLRVEVEVKPPT